MAKRCFVVADFLRQLARRSPREIEGGWVQFLAEVLSVVIGLAMAFLSGVGVLSLSLRGGRG